MQRVGCRWSSFFGATCLAYPYKWPARYGLPMTNDRSVGSSRSMNDHADPWQYARYDVEDNPTIPGGTSGLCEIFLDYTIDFRAGLTQR